MDARVFIEITRGIEEKYGDLYDPALDVGFLGAWSGLDEVMRHLTLNSIHIVDGRITLMLDIDDEPAFFHAIMAAYVSGTIDIGQTEKES